MDPWNKGHGIMGITPRPCRSPQRCFGQVRARSVLGQYLVSTRSVPGQYLVRRGQGKVRARRSGRGQYLVSTWSVPGQYLVSTWSGSSGLGSVWSTAKTKLHGGRGDGTVHRRQNERRHKRQQPARAQANAAQRQLCPSNQQVQHARPNSDAQGSVRSEAAPPWAQAKAAPQRQRPQRAQP